MKSEKKEFYKIKYFAPNGKLIEAYFQKTLRGYHPAELKSDESTTIQIEESKIRSFEKA